MSDMIERKAAMELRDSLADIIGARPMSSIHSALSEYRKAIAALPAQPAQGEADGLLPCPFCGGRAEIVGIDTGENAGGSCVCCTRCMASGNVDFERKENFVSNWNRRCTPTPPASAELDALVAEARERARDEFAAGHMNDAVFHGNVADAIVGANCSHLIQETRDKLKGENA